MLAALTLVLVLLGLVAFLWLRRRRPPVQRAPATTRLAAPALPPRSSSASSAPAPASAPTFAPTPTSDRPFAVTQLVMLDSLAPTDRQALLTLVRDIPRPPRALYQLLSPEFRARASSAELAELVMTEPVVAARVMAAVNSPLYGLRKPVTSLGPAITFLGLSSVRNLCLQYLMVENMARHQDAELRREFDILGRASLTASEMVLPLAKHMQLSDPASLSTQLVLSYLGRFATAFLLHKGRMQGDAPIDASRSLMQRARDEQDRLGVASGEIGLLLMQAWHLSDGLLRESRDIARILFAAVPLAGHEPATRAALGALSASLAERLARRQVTSLADYDPTLDDSDDLQSLSRHLPVPVLTQLGKVLRSGATERATA